jgi:hypothetical protein
MALQFDPGARPDPELDSHLRRAGRMEIRPAVRVAHLATRSLACPGCAMPLELTEAVGWRDRIACPFCERVASARDFVQRHGWPEVDVIARLS